MWALLMPAVAVAALESDVQSGRERMGEQLDAQLRYTKSQIEMLQRALALKLDIPDHDSSIKVFFTLEGQGRAGGEEEDQGKKG